MWLPCCGERCCGSMYSGSPLLGRLVTTKTNVRATHHVFSTRGRTPGQPPVPFPDGRILHTSPPGEPLPVPRRAIRCRAHWAHRGVRRLLPRNARSRANHEGQEHQGRRCGRLSLQSSELLPDDPRIAMVGEKNRPW